jgi:D-xylose transport system ATP-binding protein
MRDIFEVSDRITVLRHGDNVATYKTSETSTDEIVVAMTSGLDVDASRESSNAT